MNFRNALCLITMTVLLLGVGCQGVLATPVPEPTATAQVDMAYAAQLYRALNCSSCHQLNGVDPSPRPGPTHNGMGTTAEARIRDPAYAGVATTPAEYIRESIVSPRAYVVEGFRRTRLVMPAFANLEERELNALVQMLLQAP
jgi:mono/diheme cytochrome c family protein